MHKARVGITVILQTYIGKSKYEDVKHLNITVLYDCANILNNMNKGIDKYARDPL